MLNMFGDITALSWKAVPFQDETGPVGFDGLHEFTEMKHINVDSESGHP